MQAGSSLAPRSKPSLAGLAGVGGGERSYHWSWSGGLNFFRPPGWTLGWRSGCISGRTSRWAAGPWLRGCRTPGSTY